MVFGPNINRMEKEKNIQGLIQLFRSRNRNVQKNAAFALVRIGELAVGPLLQVLNDANWVVRANAITTLAEMKEQRVVEPCIRALNDSHHGVRGAAAITLGELGDKRAVMPLIQSLNDEHPYIRREAAFALGSLEDMSAQEPLNRVLFDKDSGVQDAANQALAHIIAIDTKRKIAKIDKKSEVKKNEAVNFCSQCGVALLKDAKFCYKCGNSLIEKPYQNQSDTEITNSSEVKDIRDEASSLYEKGDFSEAIVLYNKLLGASSGLVNRYEIRQSRAMAYCKLGRFSEAEQELKQILDVLGRNNPQGSKGQAMYWYLVARYKGDEEKAMKEFVKL